MKIADINLRKMEPIDPENPQRYYADYIGISILKKIYYLLYQPIRNQISKAKVSSNQRLSAVAHMKRLVKDSSHQCSERSRRKREARMQMDAVKKKSEQDEAVKRARVKVQETASKRRESGGSPLTSIEKNMRERLMSEWQKNALNSIMDPVGYSTNIESKLSKTQISPTMDIFQS